VTASDLLYLRPVTRPVMDRMFFSRSPYGRKLRGIDIEKVVEMGRELVEEKPRTRAELRPLLAERWPEHDSDSLGRHVLVAARSGDAAWGLG
jgi:hypothetical protein